MCCNQQLSVQSTVPEDCDEVPCLLQYAKHGCVETLLEHGYVETLLLDGYVEKLLEHGYVSILLTSHLCGAWPRFAMKVATAAL